MNPSSNPLDRDDPAEDELSAEISTAILGSEPGQLVSGQILKGRYRIVRRLASGGFGVVYLAHDQTLDGMPVVVKMLQSKGLNNRWIRAKFEQERSILSRINHPCVVSPMDFGEDPGGAPFLVIQYVDGISLRELLKRGPMDLDQIAKIIHQIGQGLGAAHDKGVIHRDLKPENVMLQTIDGGELHVKLIDFGVSSMREAGSRQSGDSVIAGTIAYMAPEQLKGEPVFASDIFALAQVIHEMITGVTAEVGPNGPPKPLRASRPFVSEEAEGVLAKALAPSPSERYQSAREFTAKMVEALRDPRGQVFDGTAFIICIGTGALPDAAGPDAADKGVLPELREFVKATPEYQRAERTQQVLLHTTGDRLLIIFPDDSKASVRCAIEIASKQRSGRWVRFPMAIHLGHVGPVASSSPEAMVPGEGIAVADRIMRLGDMGHILVTQAARDALADVIEWQEWFRHAGVDPIGSTPVFNFSNSEIGNSSVPRSLQPRWWSTRRAILIATVLAAGSVLMMAIFLTRLRFDRQNDQGNNATPSRPPPQAQPVIPERSAAASSGRSLAVVAFASSDQDPKWSQLQSGIADMFTEAAARTGRFRVLERAQLNKAIQELKLGRSAMMDAATAQRFGRLIGAQYIVLGSFQVFLDDIRVNARIIRVETAEIVIARSVTGKAQNALRLSDDFAVEFFNALR